MTTPADQPAHGSTRSRRRRVVLSVLGLAILAFLYANLPLSEWMTNFDLYVANLGPTGPPLYGAGFAISVALFLPVLPFSLGAGALFGFWTGLTVALFGTTGGATLSFLLSRTLLRDQVEKRMAHHPTFHALDRAITRSGGQIVFLTRLAPIFPFSIINMAYGLTGVRPQTYVIATGLGMIPTSAVFVFLGATAADLATPEEDMLQTSLK
ncbi:MAG: TVP38/TMEM64 family protein, partial [Myxococcota bacterium]|nr:TVP38/TMEM64 family protein [Myxococcota bacterium]